MQSCALGDHFLWDPNVFHISPPSSAEGPCVCLHAAATCCTSLLFNQSWGDGSRVSCRCKSGLAVSMWQALLLLSV